MGKTDLRIIEASKGLRMKDSGTDQFRLAFVSVFELIGLPEKNWPQGMTETFLIDEIKRAFGRYAVTELPEAFRLAVTGELGNIEDLTTHYNNFSIRYVSKVLKAYIERRNDAKALEAKEEAKLLSKPQEKSAAELIAIEEEYLEVTLCQPFETFLKTGTVNFTINGPYLYDLLTDRKALLVTKDEKIKTYEESKAKFKGSLMGGNGMQQIRENRRVLKDIEENGFDNYKLQLQKISKILTLEKWFKQLKTQGVDLRSYLQTFNLKKAV